MIRNKERIKIITRIKITIGKMILNIIIIIIIIITPEEEEVNLVPTNMIDTIRNHLEKKTGTT